MPIFEYRCQACGTRFEKLVRRSGGVATEVACPQCGATELNQELSTFAAHSGNGSKASTQPSAQSMMGGCPAGMCRTPDVCGRN